jgi:hypothetical protein
LDETNYAPLIQFDSLGNGGTAHFGRSGHYVDLVGSNLSFNESTVLDSNLNFYSNSITVNNNGATPYLIGSNSYSDFYIQGVDSNNYYPLYMTQGGTTYIGAGSVGWAFELDGGIVYSNNSLTDQGPGTLNCFELYVNNVPVATGVLTVATLPTAAAGARSFVSDSTVVASGNFGNIVSGLGIYTVPVWSDGTNWYIG